MIKRILCFLVLVVLLIPSFGFAETDYSSFSDEELIAIQEEVSKELLKRNNVPYVFISETFGLHLPVSISSSDDPHVYYLPDFIGKNLAAINVIDTEIGKHFYYFGPRDEYRKATNTQSGLWLELVSLDGEYINFNDKESLKQYTIIWQSPAPNTAITFSFEFDRPLSTTLGKLIEYYEHPSSQSVQAVTLYVVKK